MELIDAIQNRKSIRSYKNTEISNEIIEDLINCARLAPSAKNRQPWKFVVIKNEMKNKIIEIMLEKEKNPDSKFSGKVYPTSVPITVKAIEQAPILILVLREKDDNWRIGDALSIGAAVEHICLRATDLGLASLWIRDTIYAEEEILKLISQENMNLICAISIGYSNENKNPKPRKTLEEILMWYK